MCEDIMFSCESSPSMTLVLIEEETNIIIIVVKCSAMYGKKILLFLRYLLSHIWWT